MNATRPFRSTDIFASPCVDCKSEVESVELPVPLRCPSCQIRRDKDLLKDKPSPVRTTA